MQKASRERMGVLIVAAKQLQDDVDEIGESPESMWNVSDVTALITSCIDESREVLKARAAELLRASWASVEAAANTLQLTYDMGKALSAPFPGDDLQSKSAICLRGPIVCSDSFWGNRLRFFLW